MVFSNCFLCLFLIPLSSAVGPPPSPDNCPPEGRVVGKLQNLTAALNNINSSLTSVLDLIDLQCPCPDGSANCFENRVVAFRTDLENLIDDVENVTTIAPTDCPDRTGAVFVATCDGTDVAVVDPNSFIQNGFNTGTNVTAWAIYINGDTYGIDYFRNDPFEVRCLSTPDGIEVQLGSASDDPLTLSARGSGIFFDPVTGNDYVGINFDNASLNGIYCFSRAQFPLITLLFPYAGDIGRIVVKNGFVYIIHGQKIVTRRLDGTDDWAIVLIFSTVIKDLDVTDDGKVVFTEVSGALWIFNPDQGTYRQLQQPSSTRCSASSVINPCDSLLYVANENDAELQIFNATSSEFVGSLRYTLSTASPCPSIGFDPTFCCA